MTNDTDRHDPDPRAVLDRLIQRLPPDDKHRAREAVAELARERDRYEERARARKAQRDNYLAAVHDLEDGLEAAKRGDVTAEMADEVSAEQVRAYLEGASGWTFTGGWWLHDPPAGGIHLDRPDARGIIYWIEIIAIAEDRGEVAVWLDVRAQEVDDE